MSMHMGLACLGHLIPIGHLKIKDQEKIHIKVHNPKLDFTRGHKISMVKSWDMVISYWNPRYDKFSEQLSQMLGNWSRPKTKWIGKMIYPPF